jgi:peroxiredoxin
VAASSKFTLLAILVALTALGAGIYAGWTRSVETPDVNFIDVRGDHFALSALKGNVVLVNFWATSCTVCVAEMPKLVQTHEKYRHQGLETVAVAMAYDPPDRVFAFAEQNRLPFRVALDLNGQAMNAFGGIRGTPTTFLMDRHGRIVRRFEGEPDFGKLGLLIERELAKG